MARENVPGDDRIVAASASVMAIAALIVGGAAENNLYQQISQLWKQSSGTGIVAPSRETSSLALVGRVGMADLPSADWF